VLPSFAIGLSLQHFLVRRTLYNVRRFNVPTNLDPEGLVKISSSAVSLNVEDVAASGRFLTAHFGFREEMATDGFASLARDDAGMNVIFLRRGLKSLPEDQRNDHAAGLILAFVVDDLEGELARLRAEGVPITMPLTVEEWGERAFQVRDPNGVIIQLVDWNAPTGD
jgi:catechol 2,3-dioxygenase-like lactoylglutathione lyase family enzyme